MDWDPGLYEQFREHRERPAADLLNQMTGLDPQLVYDLGCATGRITRLLAERYPQARVVGIDLAETMVERDRSDDPTNLRFEVEDIGIWEPVDRPDVIFSNAALHWLADHKALFPRLLGMLAPHGYFYFQMPSNFAAPDHHAIQDVIHDHRWGERLSPLWSKTRVHGPEFYVELLGPACIELDVWETVYYHRLEGPNPVARWIEGAALRPYLGALGDDRAEFMSVLEEQIQVAYPPDGEGMTLIRSDACSSLVAPGCELSYFKA